MSVETMMSAPARSSAAALTRVLGALTLGAAAVLAVAVVGGPGPGAAEPSAPVTRVVVPDNPAAVPVDGSVRPDEDVRWSEQDGTLVRDCSRRYGCGPWYDTSYGPGNGPPMDYLDETPVPSEPAPAPEPEPVADTGAT